MGSGVAVGIDLDTTWRWDGTAKQRAGLFYSTHVSKHGSRGDIDRKILVGVVIRRPSTTEAGRLRGANCRGWGEKPLRRLERSSSRDIPYRLPCAYSAQLPTILILSSQDSPTCILSNLLDFLTLHSQTPGGHRDTAPPNRLISHCSDTPTPTTHPHCTTLSFNYPPPSR